MKEICICLLALVAPTSAKNLFSNGTMDTAGGWKGTKRIIEEPKKTEGGIGLDETAKPNRYLVLSAHMKDLETFSQEVDSKDTMVLRLSFRYMTKDYVGRGLELRGVRTDGGSTYTSKAIVADGKWHVVTWEFDQVSKSRKIDFKFSLWQGKGDVFFDDFVVEPSM
jgi:hypothetical protein